MYVSDIYEDCIQVLGSCDQPTVFRRLTDAAKRFNHKGISDLTVYNLDLCCCDGCVTLPAEVYTVLGINVNGKPSMVRDQWFRYHIGGSGDEECLPCQNYSNEDGEWSTYKDPSAPVYLVAVTETAQDNNKKLRVYGWDVDGKRIYTTDPGGTLQDGFYVPTIYGSPVRNNEPPPIARIERIQKDVTVGFIKLLAVNTSDLSAHTMIGYYQPGETEPRYRRIRVPGQSWARVAYKKKDEEIRALTDWIAIDNREAFLYMLKAVKQDGNDRHDLAAAAEAVAVKLMNEEAEAKRPKHELSGPQVIYADTPQGTERMFYGG